MADKSQQKPQQKRGFKDKEEIIKRRRRAVIVILIELIFCLVLSIVAYGVKVLSSYEVEDLNKDVYVETMNYTRTKIEKQTVEVTDDHGNVSYETVDIQVVEDLKGYRNFLILGVDEHEYNTDVMIIASINNDTGEIRLVSVLRDTLLRMEDGTRQYGYNKANSQYYYGITETVSMINRNLGLDIKDYMVVNWFGAATCINQLGGIEMTIPNDFVLSEFNGYLTAVNETTGIWAPQLDAPGTYLMTGTQVVAFCRIRHYRAWNDFGRTANQREAIGKIFNKVKELAKAGEINTILNVVQTGLGNVKTNMRLPDIMYLATEIEHYSFGETAQFPQKFASNTALALQKYHISDCLMAEDFEAEVKQLHLFLFDDPDYEPSAQIKEISREMYNARMGY